MVKPPLEIEVAAELTERVLPPLRLRLVTREEYTKVTSSLPTSERLDVILEACGERLPTARFAAEYKRQWTPKMLATAVAQAEQYARQSGLLPLVVIPYLSEERLLELEGRGVSGLDLCGNGVIIVPGKYTVFRSGKSNRFTTSAPIKNVYRGATSLVARTFLIQPIYSSVNGLTDFIAARGGIVSRATISKALQGMEDDLLISRQKGMLRLIQPDKVVALLERNFVQAAVTREIIGRSSLPLPQLRKTLAQRARETDIGISATGISSAPRYATLAMEEEVALYCRDAESLLIGLSFEETKRFPNLRLLETSDPTVMFDVRRDDEGFPWASPVQTYLEMAKDEPRLRQSATEVREGILNAPNNEEAR